MSGFIVSAKAILAQDFSGLGLMEQVSGQGLSLFFLGRFYNTTATKVLDNYRKKRSGFLQRD